LRGVCDGLFGVSIILQCDLPKRQILGFLGIVVLYSGVVTDVRNGVSGNKKYK
jgi:hypothetical protein